VSERENSLTCIAVIPSAGHGHGGTVRISIARCSRPGTTLGPYDIMSSLGTSGGPPPCGSVRREGWGSLLRLRREAVSARPRRSSARIRGERRRAEAQRDIGH